MTREEVVKGLLSCARQSDDAAASCEIAAKYHRPEFEANVHVGLPDAISETSHARALELYAHVINNEHEARRLREEAKLFRAAADLLDEERNHDRLHPPCPDVPAERVRAEDWDR